LARKIGEGKEKGKVPAETKPTKGIGENIWRYEQVVDLKPKKKETRNPNEE